MKTDKVNERSSIRICGKCGCKVDRETELDYPWVCPNCNKNMFNVETDTIYELSISKVLYGLYLHDWLSDHDEGDPVCFNEFMDNEFWDTEIVANLFTKYELPGEFILRYESVQILNALIGESE